MELFKKENANIAVEATTQEEVLEYFAQQALELGYVDNAEECFNALVAREQESTTGFGNGIAVPHARYASVKQAGILFARLNQEVEWQSIDERPVEVCICILAPETDGNLHLLMLSKLTRRLIYEEFTQFLKETDDLDMLTQTIQDSLLREEKE